MKTKKSILIIVLFVFVIVSSFANSDFKSIFSFENTELLSPKSSNSIIVTNTNNSGPGSLRQAIIDANANTSADSILFNIPLSDPGYDYIRGVFRINVSGFDLNPITRKYLVIDGFSQTRFTGNTNTSILGSGGVVGVDSINFPQFDGLEIEIADANNLAVGLKVNASYVKLQGLTILGFGNGGAGNHANIVVSGNIKHVVIEKNILGIRANSMNRPDSLIYTGGSNIVINGSDSGVIRQNLLAWAGVAGIYATADADSWLVEYNESCSNGFGYSVLDGMDYATSSGKQIIRYNKIYNNAANGLDSYLSNGYNVIENNSIYNNGIINWENSGIRVYGENDIIRKNIIHSNRGSGILITSAADYHIISQNSIWGNGAFASNGIAATKAIGINLITATENHSKGSSPYYTLNDFGDYDIGGNGLINYPVISSVRIMPDSIEIEGFASEGSKIEFFIGDTLASAIFPQGKYYLFSANEGSSSDYDNTWGSYGPMPFNGINQGSDSTAKFKFIFPLNNYVSNGSIITATATKGNRTSEFSPAAKAYFGNPVIKPVLDCIFPNANNSYTAVFGYNNPYNSYVNIGVGQNNGVNQNNSDLGQPSVFIPGYHSNIFAVQFNNTATWKIYNELAIADTNSIRCPVDLSIDKKITVVNDSIYKNDTIGFQIIIKNNSLYSASDIIVLDTLNNFLHYISSNTSKGNYNQSNGKWSISYLAAMDTAVLIINTRIDTSTQNDVSVWSSAQTDLNPFNNSSFASVSVSNSSSGNNGGLESNGNLASKTANRNFLRHKYNDSYKYANIQHLESFTYEKVADKKIKTSKASKSTQTEIVNFIPQNGPLNTQGFITTPTDLLGVSNAIEVFAVDYFKNNNERKAAILAIASSQSTVYEHTKLICDRLDGATLDDIKHVNIAGYPFIMARMVQDNGEVDYAVSFIAYKTANTYHIDNKWDLESYHPEGNQAVLNFQVWSVSEKYTIQLVESIINRISYHAYSINFENKYPSTIPSVYVRNGYYKNGKLYLEIQNNAEATSLIMKGNYAITEDGNRYPIKRTTTINKNKISNVVINSGNLFDIGFTLINNEMGGKDVLYYADGPWGLDYEQNGVVISEYQLSASMNNTDSNAYLLDRDIYLEGSVKGYISAFRVLKVGNKAVNLSGYSGLSFSAFGNGTYEIIVSKKSITQWNQQYKTSVNLNYTHTEYHIPFSELVNQYGQHNFNANDVVTVSFIKKGNGQNFQNFTLSVNNLRFDNFSVGIEDKNNPALNNELSIYPNPFNKNANLNFKIKKAYHVKIKIYSADGSLTKVLINKYYNVGEYDFNINSEGLEEGVYFVRLETDTEINNCKIIIMK